MLLLIFPKEGRDGAAQGVQICLAVLVPSLFPFMAATQLAAESGVCQKLAPLLHPLMQRLFGLSGALAPVLALSLAGGYPVGAGGIAALYRRGVIGEKEAQQAALFAVCAGPGFTVSFIGQTLYGSPVIGIVLFAAQAISVILTGILLKAVLRPSAANGNSHAGTLPPQPFAQGLVSAVNRSARGMLSICAFVVLFSAVNGIAARLVTNGSLQTVLSVMLEVCGAVTRSAGRRPMWVIAFSVGFGGICVHCQIFGILDGIAVRKALFFLIRIIQGTLTALLTQGAMCLFPQTVSVFSTASGSAPALFGGSAVPGAVLLTVSIFFLISVKQLLFKRR